jgi:hypothetical protein
VTAYGPIRPDVVALLAEFHLDPFFVPEECRFLDPKTGIVDEAAARRYLALLASEHPHLEEDQRALLQSATPRELRWAELTWEAALEGLDLRLIDQGKREFEVRWRRPGWGSRSGYDHKKFPDEFAAADHVELLRQGGELEYLKVVTKPLVVWTDWTDVTLGWLDEPDLRETVESARKERARVEAANAGRAPVSSGGYRTGSEWSER